MSDDGRLAERFAALVPKMRQDTRESLALFLDSAESQMGGRLIMAAPCRWRSRDFTEGAFRTEMYGELG